MTTRAAASCEPLPALIVIPARNEARNLPQVVADLRRERPRDRLLVVDDASQDETARVARELGCALVSLPIHLGYGGAVQTGVKYGMERGHPVIVTFDGDGQHDAADVAPLVQAVEQGADVAIGSRVLAPDAHRGSPLRQAGRGLFGLLVRALTGLALTDPTSGLKALGTRGQQLFALARFPDRFPDADALVLARRARLRIAERPARMRPSLNAHSMHDGYRAVAYSFNMCLSLLVAAMGREGDLRG